MVDVRLDVSRALAASQHTCLQVGETRSSQGTEAEGIGVVFQPPFGKIFLPTVRRWDMRESSSVEERVRRQLGKFLRKSDIRDVDIRVTTDLIKDAGFTSLQGVEFV